MSQWNGDLSSMITIAEENRLNIPSSRIQAPNTISEVRHSRKVLAVVDLINQSFGIIAARPLFRDEVAMEPAERRQGGPAAPFSYIGSLAGLGGGGSRRAETPSYSLSLTHLSLSDEERHPYSLKHSHHASPPRFRRGRQRCHRHH